MVVGKLQLRFIWQLCDGFILVHPEVSRTFLLKMTLWTEQPCHCCSRHTMSSCSDHSFCATMILCHPFNPTFTFNISSWHCSPCRFSSKLSLQTISKVFNERGQESVMHLSQLQLEHHPSTMLDKHWNNCLLVAFPSVSSTMGTIGKVVRQSMAALTVTLANVSKCFCSLWVTDAGMGVLCCA